MKPRSGDLEIQLWRKPNSSSHQSCPFLSKTYRTSLQIAIYKPFDTMPPVAGASRAVLAGEAMAGLLAAELPIAAGAITLIVHLKTSTIEVFQADSELGRLVEAAPAAALKSTVY